jgi:hypothetical protein
MRLARVLVVTALAVAVLGACGDADRRLHARTIDLGTDARTALGGNLVVRDLVDAGQAERGFGAVVADVRACAPRARVITRADPTVFGLETSDGRLVRGEPIREPALRADPIAPGACTTGLVTFRIRADQRPTGVVYLGATRIRWRVR